MPALIRIIFHTCCTLALCVTAASACAQDVVVPKPIPQSRQTMLQALEQLKQRMARLPLEGVSQSVSEPNATDRPSPSKSLVNNGRMRAIYLPDELNQRYPQTGEGRPATFIPYELATELFWIVSRINNCHYCLGHQEHKLLAAGVTEMKLLDLDTDWSAFPPAEQSALAFAQKLTQTPHAINRQDVARLQTYYNDDEILEIAFLVGRYNATNRWTDSLGIPQEMHRQFTSQLTPELLSRTSRVASSGCADRTSFPVPAVQGVTQSLLVSSLVPENAASLSPHERLVASIPAAGQAWQTQVQAAYQVGTLPQLLRYQIGYLAAREDQAKYMQAFMLGHLQHLGMTKSAIKQLGSVVSNDSPAESAGTVAWQFVVKLTTCPQEMTDQDIQRLQQYFTSHQIAEIVYHIGLAAVLDRITIVAGLVPDQNQ